MPRIRFAIGCHPHNAVKFDAAAEERLRAMLRDTRVAALGEIGLDYHYDYSPRDVQQEVFRRQLRIARELGLPVSLHIREAHDDALRILDEEGAPDAGVILHCFNLGPEDVQPWVQRDCHIAVGGPVTFKNADDLRQAVRLVPRNRLLTETDCPYMAPVPLRGMECEPAQIVFTADMLAQACGIEGGKDRAEFFTTLHDNALSLLDCEPLPWQDISR